MITRWPLPFITGFGPDGLRSLRESLGSRQKNQPGVTS
jgi:hypothetical protein